MIRITLYKNCILNDKYKNVFSKTVSPPSFSYSAFSAYLNSLTKKTYTIDYIYQDDMTSLNFKLESEDYGNIYEYNYMCIESLDDTQHVSIQRFAFINSIKIGNEIAKVSYKIDIWHTYIDYVNNINICLLKGLRVINGTGGLKIPNFRKLPVDYQGNNYLNFTSVESGRNINTRCSLLIQIQVYQTATFGENTASTCKYFMVNQYIYHNKISDNQWVVTSHDFTLANVQIELERIINLSGDKNFMLLDGSSQVYYKIGKVYIIPYDIDSKFNTAKHKIQQHDLPTSVSSYYEYQVKLPKNSSLSLFEYNNYLIPHNFVNKGIGFTSLFFPVDVNGTNIKVKLLMSFSDVSFTFILSCQNKFIDISGLFEIFPVTTQLSGDVLAQQRISRAINNLEDIGTAVKRSANFVGSLYGFNSNYISAVNREDTLQGLYSDYTAKDVQSSNIVGSIAGYFVDTIDSAFKRSARNAPVYNSTGMVKANNIAYLNYLNWLGTYYISPDNDDYVFEAINNLGYDVYEYINDFNKLGIRSYPSDFTDNGIYYNTIRVEGADVYGSFPLEIAKVLNKILENGVKIWYHHDINYALEHDTYAVG